MSRNIITILIFGVPLTSFANTVELTCKTASGTPAAVVYSEAAGTLGSDQNDLTPGVKLVRDAGKPSFQLISGDGTSLGSITVGGYLPTPQIELKTDSATYSCQATPAQELMERLIDNPKTLKAIAAWKAWVSKRPQPCSPLVDSQGIFQPNTNGKVALVLHGYSSSPAYMGAYIQLLASKGYTVIAPRLSGHYDLNVTDLDYATPAQWEKDARTTFLMARQFGPKVTIVGYSLGGYLASLLARLAPSQIDRMILMAPAWRVRASIGFAATVGEIFNISLNRFENLPVNCEQGYTPASGGQVLSEMDSRFEGAYDGSELAGDSAFRTSVRQMVVQSDGDEAVLSGDIAAICMNNSAYCRDNTISGLKHLQILESGIDSMITAGQDAGITVRSAIEKFLGK